MKSSRVLQIACASTAVLLLGACSDQSRSPTAPSTAETAVPPSTSAGSSTAPQGISIASASAATTSAASFEIKFMTGMIDHHQMAIEMAEICLANAVHPELHAMCQDMVTAQSAEIRQMQSWLQDWYGINYTPAMKPGDEKMLERLGSMSGAEFELEFMEMMIKHHEIAIKESRKCLQKAAHTELREMCEQIIAAQTAEIAQLRSWLCQWYSNCR